MRRPGILRRKEISKGFVLISLLSLLGFALILAGCRNAPGAGDGEGEPIIEETFLLGTLVTVRVHEWDPDLDVESAIEQSLNVMEDAGNVVSVYHPGSDISAVNTGGGQPITVSPEIFLLRNSPGGLATDGRVARSNHRTGGRGVGLLRR